MSEYAEWATRHKARREEFLKSKIGKPHIRMVRMGGMLISWCCSGGSVVFDGWGPTPKSAYDCWKGQEIPF